MAAVTHLGIDRSKITHYLLDVTSADGRSKAKSFLGLGFKRGEPEILAFAPCTAALVGSWRAETLSSTARLTMPGFAFSASRI